MQPCSYAECTKKGVLSELTLFALSTRFLLQVFGQANNVDPDQKLTEYHICSKYSDSQVRANSVYPDRSPAEYHI